MRKITVVALVGLFLTLGGGSSAAQEPALTLPDCDSATLPKEPPATAIEADRVAREAFEARQYETAILKWHEAYKAYCRAHRALVFMARAYRGKGDFKQAVALYKAFLTRAPKDDKRREEVARELIELEGLIPKAPPPSAAPSAVPPPMASAVPPAKPVASSAPRPPPPAAPGAAPPPKSDPMGIVSWITLGVGSAAILTGAVLLPIGVSQVAAAEGKCPERRCPASLGKTGQEEAVSQGDTGRHLKNAAIGLFVAGGVVTVGSVVWKAASPSSTAPDAPRPHVKAAVAPSGVTLFGSF